MKKEKHVQANISDERKLTQPPRRKNITMFCQSHATQLRRHAHTIWYHVRGICTRLVLGSGKKGRKGKASRTRKNAGYICEISRSEHR